MSSMAVKSVKIRLLKRLLEGGTDQQIVNAIDKVHPADLTRLFPDLSEMEMKRLVDCLFKQKKAGEVLSELPEYFLPRILDLVELERFSEIIARQSTDDAVYLLSQLPEDRWADVLAQVEPDKRAKIEQLMVYPKDSAGSAMSLEYFAVSAETTVEEVLKKLREFPGRESIFYIYVLEGKRLVGVVPLRNLVLSDGTAVVKDIMKTAMKTILATDDQSHAAQIVGRYNLLAIPVVNENQEMQGVITVDDVIDIFQDEATEDLYHMAGLSEEDRAFTPVSVKVKKRLPWMLINLATALVASLVIGHFEDTISKSALLAAFMTIVASMGGNGGIQSLVVITRSIALGELAFSKAYGAITREVLNGLFVGLCCGLVAAGVAYIYKGNIYFGLILFLALTINMTISGLAGALIPLMLKGMKLDPAQGSGVIVTMFTDMVGFFVYLSLAKFYLEKIV